MNTLYVAYSVLTDERVLGHGRHIDAPLPRHSLLIAGGFVNPEPMKDVVRYRYDL